MTPEVPIEKFEVFSNGLDHPECLAFDRVGWLWAGGLLGGRHRLMEFGLEVLGAGVSRQKEVYTSLPLVEPFDGKFFPASMWSPCTSSPSE